MHKPVARNHKTHMKYFLIAGEASGDLHAAHLMHALRDKDPEAEFRFYGGDNMAAEAPGLLRHYRTLAYMGVVAVVQHLPEILRGMRQCREQISDFRPDVVILVDYADFNLRIARYVKEKHICPVFYYISPKLWAWKEGRIKQIKRDVDHLYSILPFEKDFFEQKHGYGITYVGNPTADEIHAFTRQHGAPMPDGKTIALLPGSRHQEVRDNLSRMLIAAEPLPSEGYSLAVAVAPALPRSFYEEIIAASPLQRDSVELVEGKTYELLSRAVAALVTSGTATLETALLRVPQVVCYFTRFGRIVSLLRRLLLKVKYISLVNLIADSEVVPELVANEMTPESTALHLKTILPGGNRREEMLRGYETVAERIGDAGAPQKAADEMLARLKKIKEGKGE